MASYRYDAFGRTISQSGAQAANNPFRLSSQELHSSSGLYAYRYRFYDPAHQRWINEDPLGIAGGINYYRFVGNDPVNRVDPDGRFLEVIADLAFIAYDGYRIVKDNVFGNCDNLGENLTALGMDTVGAMVPMATGLGQASRMATKADDVVGGFRGSKGFELKNSPQQPVRNAPGQINGRQFTGHAFDQMQNRGIMPSAVEDTITTGSRVPGNMPRTSVHFKQDNNISVITDSQSGRVITVRRGNP